MLAVLVLRKVFPVALEKQLVLGKNKLRTNSLNCSAQLLYVKVRFNGVLSYFSRRMTSLKNYVKNLNKCVIFKASGCLPLRVKFRWS